MSLSFLFGKTVKPEEVVRKWQRELRKEERNIERSIRDLDREEQKVKLEIKQAAKRGDQKTARILAKQIVQSRRAKERMYKSKAELHSISLALTHQLATMKVSGALAKSAAVMQSMNNAIKLPAIQQTMMAMGREMEKMGLIEEFMDDALELDEDEEDEAQEEVDKVLDSILLDIKPVPVVPVPEAVNTQEDVDLQARLHALSAV